MAFKEGVDVERVTWFRSLVAKAKDLDAEIDAGTITPDEAFEALDKTMAGMAKPKKAEAKAEKETAKA